jgi:WD40 repeat protein
MPVPAPDDKPARRPPKKPAKPPTSAPPSAPDPTLPADAPRARDLSEAETTTHAPGGRRLNAGDEPVPGYHLVRPLGRGGFGEVWEATAPGNFKVALKLVPLDHRAGTTEMRALEILREIRHPNLLTVFGAWQTDDWLVIGMELADRTLWDRYEELQRQGQSGIPLRELLRYSQEAAKVLDYLNKPRHFLGGKRPVGIQHCDVKPQNILLVGEGVKVADFGLMQLLERRVADHLGGLTCSYAAPEFFQGQITRWSDQYSLAVTYCQLRSGRLPFTGTAAKVQEGHLRRPPDLSMLPESESQAVARALAKVPARRWPNCRAFVRALVECTRADGQPAGAAAKAGLKTPNLLEQLLASVRMPGEGDLTGSREFLREFLTAVGERGGHRHPLEAGKGWLKEIDGVVSAQVQEILEHPEFRALADNWQRQWDRAKQLGPGVRDSLRGTLARTAPEVTLQVRNRLALEGGEIVVELQFITIDDFEPAGLVQQVPALRRLAETRQRLAALVQRLAGDGRVKAQLTDTLSQPESLKALARDVGLAVPANLVGAPTSDQAPTATVLEEAPAAVAGMRLPVGGALRPPPPSWAPGRPSLARRLLAVVLGLAFLGCLVLWAHLQGWIPWDEIGTRLTQTEWQVGVSVGVGVAVLLALLFLFLPRKEPRPEPEREVPLPEETRPPLEAVELYKTFPRPAPTVSAAEAAEANLTLSSPLSSDVLQQLRGLPGAPVQAPVEDLSTADEALAARSAGEMRCLEGHTDSVWAVAFLPDGFSALSGGADNTLRLWYLATSREAERFEGHTEGVTGVAVTADGRRALSGSLDGTLRLWELDATGVRVFTGHADEVTSVALTEDGTRALSGSRDGTVRLWDAETGREIRRFEGHRDWVHAVALSPDGRRAVSGGKDRDVRLWDVETGHELRRFEGHGGWVNAVAFSPDGRRVLSGSGGPFSSGADYSLRLWDAQTGKEVRRLTGHTDWVRSVAFAPDGERLLSGGDDETIRLWDVRTGKELRVFEGHTWSVLSVAFGPKGRWALSASDDKTVRLWRVWED